MPYTLNFSDPSKTETVVVPDMPPGINVVDTSLSLVGKGYPNYGLAYAQNFVKLLENFASPLPPENPIEGQLWYDTSDPTNKVLRVMDGTASSTRWPAANGIYQQSLDPKLSATQGLKIGDIWVDTASNQLKIYNNNSWILVGPTVSSGATKTGPEVQTIIDTSSTNHKVILNYIEDNVVSITANESFIPNTVISGFSNIKPGINLSSNNSAMLIGTAESSLNIKINNTLYSGDKFLRKDDGTSSGQIITGKVFFQTPSDQIGSQGRDGILINTSLTSEYIQLYKFSKDAVLLNNTAAGKIIFKTKPDTISSLVNSMTIENGSVAINTVTNSSYALDIYGNLRASGRIIINSTGTSALTVAGSAVISGSSTFNSNVKINGKTTATDVVTVGTSAGSGAIVVPASNDTYDLGSPTKYFRKLYVSQIIGGNNFSSGMITPYGGVGAPSGWLLCNGTSYSTSTYSNLFGVVGYTYGGSGSSFNVPNLTGVTLAAGAIPISYIIKT